MTRTRFLAWEASTRDTIDLKRCYVDVAGDLIAGVLLSQIVFWCLPAATGNPKLRVHRDGRLWLAKGRESWWQECRIKPKQFDRAARLLVGRGIISTEKYRFAGSPVVHLTINWEVFLLRLEEVINRLQPPDSAHFPFWENGTSHFGKMELPKMGSPITETTPETTSKKTTTTTDDHPVVVVPTETAIKEIVAGIAGTPLEGIITKNVIKGAIRDYRPEVHDTHLPETPAQGVHRILWWMLAMGEDPRTALINNPVGFLRARARKGMDKPAALLRREQAAEAAQERAVERGKKIKEETEAKADRSLTDEIKKFNDDFCRGSVSGPQ